MESVQPMEDLQLLEKAGDSAADNYQGEDQLDPSKWALPPTHNAAAYQNGYAAVDGVATDYEKDRPVWESSRDKLYPINLGRNEFTEEEAMQYGLDGLIGALEKTYEGHQPIISQDHLNAELLKQRIMEL